MSADNKVRVVIACDQPIVRAGLLVLIGKDPAATVVGEAADLASAVAKIIAVHPDVLLVDVPLAGLSGPQVLVQLRKRIPFETAVRILTITDQADRFQIFEALELGARGILVKQATPSLLMKAIHRIASGEYWVPRDLLLQWIRSKDQGHRRNQLSDREREIVHEVIAGASNHDIASMCGITEATARRHLAHVCKKLGVSGRLELVLYAVKHQL